MRKQGMWLCVFLFMFMLSFTVGCGVTDEKFEAEDFHIKVSETTFDFTQNVTFGGKSDGISCDSSAVVFGTVGAYDVVFAHNKASITKKCYVYGLPSIVGSAASVTYAEALSGAVPTGITATDSFSNAVSVTMGKYTQDAFGRIAYGSNQVTVTATDKAGNTATTNISVEVLETQRPIFEAKTIDVTDGNLNVELNGFSVTKVLNNNEVVEPSGNYVIKNGAVLFLERFLASLDYNAENRIVLINESVGWAEFSLTVTDKELLQYTAPIGKGFKFARGDIALPAIALDMPAQICEIIYTINPGEQGETVLGQDAVFTGAMLGEYTYNIKINRNGNEIYNKSFVLSVVTQDEYLATIFSADSDRFMDNFYIDSTLAEPTKWLYSSDTFRSEYTDKNNITKNAALFNKTITDANYQRDLYMAPDILNSMMEAGFKTITMELCMMPFEGLTPQVRVLGLKNNQKDPSEQWTNLKYNEWTTVSFDLAILYGRYKDEETGLFTGVRFVTTEADGGLKPYKVYISSITAGKLFRGVTSFEGTYACDDKTIEIKDGIGTFTGDTVQYVVTVTDDFAIRFTNYATKDYKEGIIGSGIIILNDEFYAITSDPNYNILEGENKTLPSLSGVFAKNGYAVEYYTVSGQTETKLESLTGAFEVGTVTLRSKVLKADKVIGAITQDILVMSEYDYYSQNLATAANLDKFTPLGVKNGIATATRVDKNGQSKQGLKLNNVYADGSNNYAFIINKEFVQGALAAGFDGFKSSCLLPELNQICRLAEWFDNGWDYSKPIGYLGTVSQWQNNNKWDSISSQDKKLTDLNAEGTLMLHFDKPGTFYIADFQLLKTKPTDDEFEKDFAAEGNALNYLWSYNSNNSIAYMNHTDKNQQSKAGLHIINANYTATDSTRTFHFGGASMIARAKELGYTKIKLDICVPTLGKEVIGSQSSFYFIASAQWKNDNAWESKEVDLSKITAGNGLDLTFTDENTYIANIKFVK